MKTVYSLEFPTMCGMAWQRCAAPTNIKRINEILATFYHFYSFSTLQHIRNRVNDCRETVIYMHADLQWRAVNKMLEFCHLHEPLEFQRKQLCVSVCVHAYFSLTYCGCSHKHINHLATIHSVFYACQGN